MMRLIFSSATLLIHSMKGSRVNWFRVDIYSILFKFRQPIFHLENTSSTRASSLQLILQSLSQSKYSNNSIFWNSFVKLSMNSLKYRRYRNSPLKLLRFSVNSFTLRQARVRIRFMWELSERSRRSISQALISERLRNPNQLVSQLSQTATLFRWDSWVSAKGRVFFSFYRILHIQLLQSSQYYPIYKSNITNQQPTHFKSPEFKTHPLTWKYPDRVIAGFQGEKRLENCIRKQFQTLKLECSSSFRLISGLDLIRKAHLGDYNRLTGLLSITDGLCILGFYSHQVTVIKGGRIEIIGGRGSFFRGFILQNLLELQVGNNHTDVVPAVLQIWQVPYLGGILLVPVVLFPPELALVHEGCGNVLPVLAVLVHEPANLSRAHHIPATI